jgi:hypothetical protein
VLAADPILFERAAQQGDGKTTVFQTPNYPVVPDSQVVALESALLSEGVEYTFDDSLGLITLSVAPAEGVSVIITYKYHTLSDEQLQALLDLQGGDTFLAAADALDSIAASEVLIQKKIRILDLQTDGPAVAAALHKRAAALREQARGEGESEFDIAEQIPVGDTAAWWEKVVKDGMRGL